MADSAVDAVIQGVQDASLNRENMETEAAAVPALSPSEPVIVKVAEDGDFTIDLEEVEEFPFTYAESVWEEFANAVGATEKETEAILGIAAAVHDGFNKIVTQKECAVEDMQIKLNQANETIKSLKNHDWLKEFQGTKSELDATAALVDLATNVICGGDIRERYKYHDPKARTKRHASLQLKAGKLSTAQVQDRPTKQDKDVKTLLDAIVEKDKKLKIALHDQAFYRKLLKEKTKHDDKKADIEEKKDRIRSKIEKMQDKIRHLNKAVKKRKTYERNEPESESESDDSFVVPDGEESTDDSGGDGSDASEDL